MSEFLKAAAYVFVAVIVYVIVAKLIGGEPSTAGLGVSLAICAILRTFNKREAA